MRSCSARGGSGSRELGHSPGCSMLDRDGRRDALTRIEVIPEDVTREVVLSASVLKSTSADPLVQ